MTLKIHITFNDGSAKEYTPNEISMANAVIWLDGDYVMVSTIKEITIKVC